MVAPVAWAAAWVAWAVWISELSIGATRLVRASRSRTLNSPEVQCNNKAPRVIAGLFHGVVPARAGIPSFRNHRVPRSSRDDRDLENLRAGGGHARAPETHAADRVRGRQGLNLFNHGDELLRGAFTAPLAIKLALNYVTPFIMSNFGLFAHQRH